MWRCRKTTIFRAFGDSSATQPLESCRLSAPVFDRHVNASARIDTCRCRQRMGSRRARAVGCNSTFRACRTLFPLSSNSVLGSCAIRGFLQYPRKKVQFRITPPKRSRFRSGFQPIPERFRPHPQAVRHSQETSPDVDHDLSLEEVHQAYDRVRGRQLESAVFISDLAAELQIGLPKLHEWIHREVIKSGHGSLDEGHWPTATEGQRAAAIEHLGSRRLLIRF